MCRFGKKRRHGFAIRKFARQIRTALSGGLQDRRRVCLIGDRSRSRSRRRAIRNCRILSITLGMILLLRCIRHLRHAIPRTIAMVVTRRAHTQPAFLHRLFLAFVKGRRTRIKGDGGVEFSFETVTTAFANGPADKEENGDENDESDEGENAAL